MSEVFSKAEDNRAPRAAAPVTLNRAAATGTAAARPHRARATAHYGNGCAAWRAAQLSWPRPQVSALSHPSSIVHSCDKPQKPAKN